MFAEEHQKVFLQDSVLTLKKKKKERQLFGVEINGYIFSYNTFLYKRGRDGNSDLVLYASIYSIHD